MKRLAILLIVVIVISMFFLVSKEVEANKMSKLTAVQAEKLFGRKRPFISSGYRIEIERKLGRALRDERAGDVSMSQVRMTAQNIGKQNKSVRIMIVARKPGRPAGRIEITGKLARLPARIIVERELRTRPTPQLLRLR